jgi:uncharacterized protein (TIRG00374 family)
MVILKRIGGMFLRISISLVLLIFLFTQMKPGALLEIVKHADKALLVLAFLITFFSYLFCYLRWKIFLESAGIHLPSKRLVSAFSGGIFFNMFLPSTVGGDFVRSADLGYHSKKTSTVVATVLLDRLSGFSGMIVVALIALIFGFRVIRDLRIIWAIVFLVIILFLITAAVFNDAAYGLFEKSLFHPRPGKIRSGLRRVLQEMHAFKVHKMALAKSLLISIIVQASGPVITYTLALSFHLEVDIIYFFLFMPLISAVTLLPISIGGLGVREYMTILFFTHLGVSKHFAFAFSLMGFFYLLVYAGIGGLIYGLTLHNRRV